MQCYLQLTEILRFDTKLLDILDTNRDVVLKFDAVIITTLYLGFLYYFVKNIEFCMLPRFGDQFCLRLQVRKRRRLLDLYDLLHKVIRKINVLYRARWSKMPVIKNTPPVKIEVIRIL